MTAHGTASRHVLPGFGDWFVTAVCVTRIKHTWYSNVLASYVVLSCALVSKERKSVDNDQYFKLDHFDLKIMINLSGVEYFGILTGKSQISSHVL